MFGAFEETNDTGVINATKLGINSYGMSMTTLEEVFLNLGKYNVFSYYCNICHTFFRNICTERAS